MSLYDPSRHCVANEKWCGNCLFCGDYRLKKTMTAIYLKRYNLNPKVAGYICDSCYFSLCDKYEIPER